jgi:serine phosphatase RsbU (regulator of sigma subunit)
MKPSLYSHLKIGLVLGIGVLLSLMLCVQCVRTYLYTDAVLVPQQAQREAERQMIALGAAARNAGVTDPRALGSVLEHSFESASDRIVWMRVLDSDGNTLARAGSVGKTAGVPTDWRERLEKHESIGSLVGTSDGKVLVTMLPLRMPRPMRPPDTATSQIDRHIGPRSGSPNERAGLLEPVSWPGSRRPPAYVVELAISTRAVAGAFDGLRKNLVVGLTASIALLIAVAVIGLRMPQYLRGKYLEGELLLAKRVQRDLQPSPQSISSDVAFAASAVAADHVGGDFFDIFEAAPGKTAIVLGDVSGKGVSAALLVSVLQGAIRSSTSCRHESACGRINHMLCELTARARFASLFWGIYDADSGMLRYVNAGHAAPMLIRHRQGRIERLDQGGPVLGLLPSAHYSVGSVRIDGPDTLFLYSDGVNEAANEREEEFGEDRLREMISQAPGAAPRELCDRIMSQVAAFANAGPPPDDRTLMVVRFQRLGATLPRQESGTTVVGAFG